MHLKLDKLITKNRNGVTMQSDALPSFLTPLNNYANLDHNTMRSIHKKQINVPGIIGGMGPFSHLRFEQLLLDKSRKMGAIIDSMYPVYILVSATDIPDRSEALAKADQRIVGYLVNYGKILRNAGADFLVVTCNTAHVFYEEVFPQLDMP